MQAIYPIFFWSWRNVPHPKSLPLLSLAPDEAVALLSISSEGITVLHLDFLPLAKVAFCAHFLLPLSL